MIKNKYIIETLPAALVLLDRPSVQPILVSKKKKQVFFKHKIYIEYVFIPILFSIKIRKPNTIAILYITEWNLGSFHYTHTHTNIFI